jgi:hypothetical protein
MTYLLSCPKCNTNLKNFIKADPFRNTYEVYCKCPPKEQYLICSGVYIYYDDDSVQIELCYLDNLVTIYYCLDTNVLSSGNFSYKILIDLQNLELADSIYKFYLKYKNNEIFA